MTPLAHLILILITWMICQVIPRRYFGAALTLMGLVGLLIFAPVAAIFIGLTAIEAVAMVYIFGRLDRKSGWRKYGAYLLLPNLFFVDAHELILGLPVTTLAISFSTIRIFMTARQLLNARKAMAPSDPVWIFAAAYYLPAIVIGPVFSGIDLRDQQRAAAPINPEIRDGRMVLQGLILSILAATFFGGLADRAPIFPLEWVCLFLQLFAAFWGQSLLAEHSSRFFGFRLPVNFDHPWKARSIRDFWQRWHRSMAQFVLQYIFLPLNLKGVSPKLATIAAFVFMGLWHNLSFGYFVWGLAHGVMLAYAPEPGEARWQRVVGRVVLWVVVISLSWFANYGPYA